MLTSCFVDQMAKNNQTDHPRRREEIPLTHKKLFTNYYMSVINYPKCKENKSE